MEGGTEVLELTPRTCRRVLRETSPRKLPQRAAERCPSRETSSRKPWLATQSNDGGPAELTVNGLRLHHYRPDGRATGLV